MSTMRNHLDFISISMIHPQQDTTGILRHDYQMLAGSYYSPHTPIHIKRRLRKDCVESKNHRFGQLLQHFKESFFLFSIQSELMLHKYNFNFRIFIQLPGQGSESRCIRSIKHILYSLLPGVGIFLRVGLYCTYSDGVRISKL